MGILSPDPGLVFWTSLTFIFLLLILRKYAWKPILRALKAREDYIEFSIRDADFAKEEVAKLTETKKQMMESARLERERLISEARDLKNEIVREARESAKAEAEKVIRQAREQIDRERKEAMLNIKQQIGLISLEIAGKILQEELVTDERQKRVISQNLEGITFN
jgi:F-type H+-transporting ATPase subunit b